MAVKTKRISTLIESQIPDFITSEYELFTKFIQKYYEAQELQGGPLDIISNIQKYRDIDLGTVKIRDWRNTDIQI